MNPENIKAVVFDCDGVLFDTTDANRTYYNEVLASFGKPSLTQEQFVNVHMFTVRQAIEYLFSEEKNLEPVFMRLKQIGYHKFVRYMKMEPGLMDLLKALKKNGYIRAIGTNRTDTMAKVLEDYHLSDSFEMVVTAADVKKPKPDPEQLLQIKNRFFLDPEQMIFVGDSTYDEQAARHAGCWFIAFKNSLLKADLHVCSMDDIGRFLGIN